MLCMGFGIGGGHTPADRIRSNGIQFLLIGGLLNIFRWLLPGILQSAVLHRPPIEDITYCLQSDIYYFVGIFYIFYAFLKKRKITTESLLLISMLMLTLNMLLTPLTHKYITNRIAAAGLFWAGLEAASALAGIS